MAHILGLCGEAGSGKDYSAERLAKFYPAGRVHRVALADELRFELEWVLADGERLPNLWRKPYTPAVRWILQHYGTEFRRAQDPTYWVSKAAETIQDIIHEDGNAIVVVTDVRFTDEAEMVRDLGGMVVRVIAPPDTRAKRLGISFEELQGQSTHASEDINFEADGFIYSTDEMWQMSPDVTLYLGLGMCLKCHRAEDHPFHDSGTPRLVFS